LEINKTVIVASRWFLFYLTYIDDARSNTNQVSISLSFHISAYLPVCWSGEDLEGTVCELL